MSITLNMKSVNSQWGSNIIVHIFRKSLLLFKIHILIKEIMLEIKDQDVDR